MEDRSPGCHTVGLDFVQGQTSLGGGKLEPFVDELGLDFERITVFPLVGLDFITILVPFSRTESLGSARRSHSLISRIVVVKS